MQKPPIFFAAFANDNAQSLNELANEERDIRNILRNRHDNRELEFISIGQTTIDDIYNQFNSYSSRIGIFHFGGHTNSDLLQLRGGSQRASNLAKLMGVNNNLHLVVLNGCSNRDQVKWLLDNGVKVVIATSSKVNDKWASIFSKNFYSALDAGNSIKDSFSRAIIYLEGLEEDPFDNRLIVTRDILFDNNNSSSKFPWGIFTIDGLDQNYLNWTLPRSPNLEYEERNYTEELYISAYRNQLNIAFVTNALNEISKRNVEIKNKLIGFNETKSPDLLIDLENILVNIFPYSISVHLNELFTDELLESGRRRLKKIIETYSSVTKLAALIAISNVWDSYSHSKLTIHPAYIDDIRAFLSLSEEKSEYFDYTFLFVTAYHILNENRIDPFIVEIKNISNIFYKIIYESYKYLEDLKIQIINKNINKDDIIQICFDSEKHLGIIVNAFSFLVDYEFVSVRNISVRKKYRQLAPNFVHERVVKLQGGALNHSIDILRRKYTEDRSILVTKGFSCQEEGFKTHNLLPFFFDLNSFSRMQHPRPLMCVFHHRIGEKLAYQIIDKDNTFFYVVPGENYIEYEDLDILINLINQFEKDINI